MGKKGRSSPGYRAFSSKPYRFLIAGSSTKVDDWESLGRHAKSANGPSGPEGLGRTCATCATQKAQRPNQSFGRDPPRPRTPVEARSRVNRCPTCRNDERVWMRFGRSNVEPFTARSEAVWITWDRVFGASGAVRGCSRRLGPHSGLGKCVNHRN